jgi:3-deoxy-manno-octulosonate cytidylyltransferase (CMP-KDO synthetase)
MNKRVVAIIPTRLNSKRYPKKALIKIKGLSMIEHVRRRVLLSNAFEDVYVATCDYKIKREIEKFHGKVIMTSDNNKTATDRVAEAARRIKCSHIVNVQGDEILVVPNDLKILVKKIKFNQNINYWNAISKIKKKSELLSLDVVKCITDFSNKIIYCSRVINYLKVKESNLKVKKILGILAYSRKGLLNYSKLKKTNIEIFESIDQSRIVENKLSLKGIYLKNSFPGINTKQEEKQVIDILKNNKIQKNILKQVLNYC